MCPWGDALHEPVRGMWLGVVQGLSFLMDLCPDVLSFIDGGVVKSAVTALPAPSVRCLSASAGKGRVYV